MEEQCKVLKKKGGGRLKWGQKKREKKGKKNKKHKIETQKKKKNGNDCDG